MRYLLRSAEWRWRIKYALLNYLSILNIVVFYNVLIEERGLAIRFFLVSLLGLPPE